MLSSLAPSPTVLAGVSGPQGTTCLSGRRGSCYPEIIEPFLVRKSVLSSTAPRFLIGLYRPLCGRSPVFLCFGVTKAPNSTGFRFGHLTPNYPRLAAAVVERSFFVFSPQPFCDHSDSQLLTGSFRVLIAAQPGFGLILFSYWGHPRISLPCAAFPTPPQTFF